MLANMYASHGLQANNTIVTSSTDILHAGVQLPQQQLRCRGCQSMLMYPQGAQNVRCARCSVITPVSSPSQDMAQIACSNPSCRVQLMYPRGAMHVQCSLCHTVNEAQQANRLGHVTCNGCHVTLMYALGAHSVKCAVCNAVTPVGQPGGGEQGGVAPPQRTVIVENPSLGGGDANVSLGVTAPRE